MPDLRTTLLVAIALLSTHPQQPLGRETADELKAHLDQQLPPITQPRTPQEDEDQ